MNASAGSDVFRRGPRILVLGYGNPGRQDDGLGPAVADALEQAAPQGVTVEADYQLNIEDSASIAEHDVVVFVDASVSGPEPFAMERIKAAAEISFTSHSVSPGSVLAACAEHFDARPEAWVLGIRGYAFEFEEGLTAKAQENCKAATAFVRKWIEAWKERHMDKGSTHKKTILAIDDDPDIRGAIRVFLETAGYVVGEASTGEEGVRTAERIKPDAIIVDLMMETVDAGSVVARTLKDGGYAGPIYLLSSAGDTVRYNIDARELGLAGIFQKPIDPKVLVSTLKARLKDD